MQEHSRAMRNLASSKNISLVLFLFSSCSSFLCFFLCVLIASSFSWQIRFSVSRLVLMHYYRFLAHLGSFSVSYSFRSIYFFGSRAVLSLSSKLEISSRTERFLGLQISLAPHMMFLGPWPTFLYGLHLLLLADEIFMFQGC